MHMQGILSATAIFTKEASKIYAVDGEGTLQIWNGKHTQFSVKVLKQHMAEI